MSEATGTAATPSPHDGLPAERRRWAITAIFIALAVASLDTAIANIALPAIAADLHVSPADVIWVVNVYQIALVATLLPLGALGEIVGHERVYLGGLALFTLASLACALAWSLESLLVARTLQGLGASGLMSVNGALVRFVYPSRLLGRGFGIQRAGGRDRDHARTDGRLRHPGARTMAVAVRDQHSDRLDRRSRSASKPCRTRRAPPIAFDFVGAAMASGCLGLFIIGIGSAAHHAATDAGADRTGRRASCWAGSCSAGRPTIRRRCCRSICSGGRCSRCRWRRRSARSRCRDWRSSHCRSTSKTSCSEPRSRPACS